MEQQTSNTVDEAEKAWKIKVEALRESLATEKSKAASAVAAMGSQEQEVQELQYNLEVGQHVVRQLVVFITADAVS